MTDRLPPHNKEAEQAVIGAMLLSTKAAEDCVAILRPEDFYHPKHGTIFGAIRSLLNQGEPVDTISVTDHLILSGDLALIGGAVELHTLTGTVAATSSAEFYARKVKDAAKMRRVATAGEQLKQMATDERDTGTAEAITERAREILDGVLGDIATDVAPIGSNFDEFLAELNTPPTFTPTGLPDLDRRIDGMRPGTLIIAAARPGEGKSILGLQMAMVLAEFGDPVAFSSLEMSKEVIFNRMLAAKARVSLRAINRRELTEEHMERIQRVRGEISSLPIFVDDRAGVTIDDIRAHVRSVARHGKPAGLVVDYLQIMKAQNTSMPRWEAVGEMSRGLREIAKEYEMPVIALAQLKREASGSKPLLSHLRESGSLEQDADVVLLQARERDLDTEEFTDYLDMWVEKNRHGDTGHLRLFFEGQYMTLTDLHQFDDPYATEPWQEGGDQ